MERYSMAQADADVFASARAKFESLAGWLEKSSTAALPHQDIEEHLQVHGREMLRSLLQAHLELRACREVPRRDVRDGDGNPLTHLRPRQRALVTIVGTVVVRRLRYGGRRGPSAAPMDVELNLPDERYSLGVRRLAAIEASRGAYDATVDAIERTTGTQVPKRQVQELVERAAQDFDAYYAPRLLREVPSGEALMVLTFDGKGVVMRPEDLRKKTRLRLARQQHKFKTRLAGGEKKDRKRMATVASVYEVAPHVRRPEDVLTPDDAPRQATKRPRPTHKRVWASLEKSPEEVIAAAFDEAEARDPDHRRTWVVPVDGDRLQVARIQAEARRRGVEITLILDFIHVLEYLWDAAWCLFDRGDSAAEPWVLERGRRILEGKSSEVAAGISRSATKRGLPKQRRTGIDECTRYLLTRKDMLRYDQFLAAGFPIATGVIEGACRHLVVDRLDITGARWSLLGAEAVLKLRSLRASGDFDAYWQFHVQREHTRRGSSTTPQ